jgi:hypothetical protein
VTGFAGHFRIKQKYILKASGAGKKILSTGQPEARERFPSPNLIIYAEKHKKQPEIAPSQQNL